MHRRGVPVHRGGTYICIEGPQFSTLAEAEVHRAHGFEVIGMTNVTEAKLAREAEICYATMAMITDYDCWHPEHESVTLRRSSPRSRTRERAEGVAKSHRNDARGAQVQMRRGAATCADYGFKLVPKETKKRLAAIIGKYIS